LRGAGITLQENVKKRVMVFTQEMCKSFMRKIVERGNAFLGRKHVREGGRDWRGIPRDVVLCLKTFVVSGKFQ
jgi:hypothetical protein